MANKRHFDVKCNGCGAEYSQTITKDRIGFGMPNPIFCCGSCGGKDFEATEKAVIPTTPEPTEACWESLGFN